MARDYVKTETMRIKMSGGAFIKEGQSLESLEIDGGSSSVAIDSETYEREFNELLESVYDAVIITNIKGDVNKYNARCLDMFDYTMQGFFRLNILNILSGASEDMLETIHKTLLNERRIFIEGFCIRKDKTVFPADVAVSVLHLHGKERLAFFIRNISSRIQTEEALHDAQKELVATAHHAGMAEIATGVLHDVGNLLNSINVSCEMITKTLQNSTLDSLVRVNKFFAKQNNPGDFIQNDPKGKKLPRVFAQLGDNMKKERNEMLDEAQNLKSKIQIIRDVISTQQNYAKAGLFFEEAKVDVMVEDAMAILKNSLEKDNLNIEKNFISVPTVHVQKSKFVHIVLNLLKNAHDALVQVQDRQGIIRIDIGMDQENENYVSVRISDNGEGIAKKDLEKIFTHGFTTKKTGHGFGLHSCANLMTEMGGRIQVQSAGKDKGASFTLILPIFKAKKKD